jgi:hypothetical protein
VQQWDEPRNTLDLDLTVLSGFGNEPPIIDTLLAEFSGRLESTRDIALGALPFEEHSKHSIDRASPFNLGDLGTIIARQRKELDWPLVIPKLTPSPNSKKH